MADRKKLAVADILEFDRVVWSAGQVAHGSNGGGSLESVGPETTAHGAVNGNEISSR